MDFHRSHRFFNILTFSLPLFCFLLHWGATTSTSTLTTTQPPSLPSTTSSALAAAEILRTRGYTLFSSAILNTLSTTSFNLSGTILAPPDFAFSFATARFTTRGPPPRPSTSLLLFHTLKPPPLTWLNISSTRVEEFFTYSDKLVPTLLNNLYLFVSRTPYGEISISSSLKKQPILAVKVRQPDLYVDDHITVHGIDGVLDPAAASKCSSFDIGYFDDHQNPTAQNQSQVVDRSFLDHAVRVLRIRGFNVAATALVQRRSQLMNFTTVTMFAPSDKGLFSDRPGGFRYDILHHVVPRHLRFEILAGQTAGMTAYDTLAPNKTVVVETIGGSVRIDGVPIDGTEFYNNRWIVVFAISTTLDDASGSLFNPNGAPPLPPESTQSQLPVESAIPVDTGTFNPSPTSNMTGDSVRSQELPLPATEAVGERIDGVTTVRPATVVVPADTVWPPVAVESLGPAASEMDPSCASGDIPIGVEGEDLFCLGTATTVRKLQEAKAVAEAAYVGECEPSDGFCVLREKVSQSAPLSTRKELTETENAHSTGKNGDGINIAEDLFLNA